jgi:ABC-type transport system involved in multi-copper enzyme maturation permease subunit
MSLLAAEFLKLRTTRTPWALLAGTVALTGLGVASAVLVGADADLDLADPRGVRSILAASAGGAVFVLVLGIIISAGEYRQRTAIDTFLTTPKRSRVIVVKIVTAALAGVAFGAAAAGAALLGAVIAYRVKGLHFPLGSGDAWAGLGGSVLYATVFAALGAATGSLVRNQVAAIVGWLVWFAVVEHVAVGFLPDVGRWLPAAAGRALVRAPGEGLLAVPVAAALLVGYAAVIAAAAVVTERYRDA